MNNFKFVTEVFTMKYAVRTSMSDYREQEWMTNIPLYAISWIKKYMED